MTKPGRVAERFSPPVGSLPFAMFGLLAVVVLSRVHSTESVVATIGGE